MDNPAPISGGETTVSGGTTPTTSPAPSQPASPPSDTTHAPSSVSDIPPASGSWFDQLPEELKGSKSLAKFKDVNNLAQAYVHAESLIGRDKIPVPKTDEDWQDVYNRLGRPATPDDYTLNADALKQMQLPEDITSVLEEDLKWFKPTAHNLGLNDRQATALMQAFVANVGETMSSRATDQDTELKQCENMLRKEYGQAYDSKVTIAQRALFTLGGEKLVDEVNKTSLGRNPAFVNMFVRIGEQMHEELGLDLGGQPDTPADLDSQIQELQRHPAFLDSTHPEHKSVVDRIRVLFERRYPNGS